MFVKICGITNESDALLAVALGADALGFVFAPSSRQVTVSTVRDIVPQLPKEILTFGVFVNELPSTVVEVVHSLGLSGAQLHGSEGHQGIREVSERVRFTMKSYHAGHIPPANEIQRDHLWAILFDGPQPGSGNVFDWSLLEGVPYRMRMVLAGGLTPNNVQEAIRRVKPFGVDVATGVEESAGKKDPRALREFIALAKAMESEVESEDLLDDEDSPYNWEVRE